MLTLFFCERTVSRIFLPEFRKRRYNSPLFRDVYLREREREKGARTYRDLLRLYMWIAFVRDARRKVRRIADAFGKTISERQSTMGIYFDYRGATARTCTQAECRSTEAANSFFFFFFFTATPPPNAPSITGNGSSSVFIRACIHAGPYTKAGDRYIYVYRIYSPSGIYSSNSKSIFPSGRKGFESGPTLRALFPSPAFRLCTEVLHKFRKHNKT